MPSRDTGLDVADVIEDSEPEREARRRQIRETRRKARALKQGIDALHMEPEATRGSPSPAGDEIISISSSSSPSHHSDVLLESLDETAVTGSSTTLPSVGDVFDLVGRDVNDSPAADSVSDHPEESRAGLDLSRFAFQTVPSRLEAPRSSTDSVPEVSVQPKSSRPAASFSALCPLSEPQLRKIDKCVCCDLKWTARKSSQMKWEHITRCAKKNAFDSETLRSRLTQEFESTRRLTDADGIKVTKGKRKAPSAPKESEAPNTLLQGLVDGAGPSNKSRKKVSAATVQSVPAAHEVILENARILLGEQPAPRGGSPLSLHTNPSDLVTTCFPLPAVDSATAVSSNPWKTPHDAAPPLLHNRVPTLRDHMAEPQDMPPATQAIPPSRLGGAFRKRPVDVMGDEISSVSRVRAGGTAQFDRNTSPLIESSHALSLDDPTVLPRNPFDLHASGSGKSPPNILLDLPEIIDLVSPPGTPAAEGVSSTDLSTPLPNHRTTNIDAEEEELEEDNREEASSAQDWEDEEGDWGAEAVLEWGGGTSDASRASTPTSADVPLATVEGVETGDTTIGKPKKARGRPPGGGRKDALDATKPKRRKKKTVDEDGEAVPAMGEEEMAAEVERELRKMIEEDEDLYLRILRYQPIKFDDLHEKAITRGLPERKLKYRLRAFLDKQCINFYSAEPTGPRRRH